MKGLFLNNVWLNQIISIEIEAVVLIGTDANGYEQLMDLFYFSQHNGISWDFPNLVFYQNILILIKCGRIYRRFTESGYLRKAYCQQYSKR